MDQQRLAALLAFLDRLISAAGAGHKCNAEISAVIKTINTELGIEA